MHAHTLASRDPAMAALIGAIGTNFGADVGYDTPSPAPGRFNVGFGDDYGFGDEDEAAYYGFGAPRVGAVPRVGHHPMRPAPHHAPMHRPAHPGAFASTAARTLLLDPNRHSTVKVERYSFSFSPTSNLVLGTASSIPTFTQNPSTSIKPQRVIVNAPAPGFVFLSTLQIANVNVFVGGTEDAFTYGPSAQNVVLDLPRLDPQNRVSASGTYSGLLPPGFVNGSQYTLVITLQGPSTMAGGYGQ